MALLRISTLLFSISLIPLTFSFSASDITTTDGKLGVDVTLI